MSPPAPEFSTERPPLRNWTREDRSHFAALNPDPEVVEHFPAVPHREQSDQMADQSEVAESQVS